MTSASDEKSYSRYDQYGDNPMAPVGPIGLIALRGSEEFTENVNYYLNKRRSEYQKEQFVNSYPGFFREDYRIPVDNARFSSGEGKAVVKNTVRGHDLYLVSDVMNCSCTYKMFGQDNRMSPDDHYQDLKRVILACSGKSRRINVIMPFLYESRQHKRNARESLDCAFALEELYNLCVANIITFDNELIPVTQDDLNLATNGQYMLFSPGHILWCCKNEQERPVRDYLHVVLHCVFRHMYVDKLIDQRCWDLACDIAVEYSITRLGLAAAAAEREALQQGVYAEQLEKVKQLTAERIYRFLLDGGMDVARMEELAPLFYADEHALWYSSEEAQEQPSDESSPASSSPDEGEDPPDSQSSGESSAPQEQPDEQMEERWSEIARRMQVDMETFSREKEDKAGGLVQNLREANRERYDYGRFLKKFAVRGEVVRINDDEFDYIYYTYGLKLYGKMPLVEPLEYKEVKRIREFVIAIDTSGSVSGKMVQLFVQKTYNILKTTESFFSKINLHIIQCDAQIQEAVKITSQREFDRYMEAMEIHGLGGTDFRPVFRYVDELREKNEFENLRGLIYLTDGFGTFPKKKPEYETAFVFVDDGVNSYDVPSWAIRLILQPEELY